MSALFLCYFLPSSKSSKSGGTNEQKVLDNATDAATCASGCEHFRFRNFGQFSRTFHFVFREIFLECRET